VGVAIFMYFVGSTIHKIKSLHIPDTYRVYKKNTNCRLARHPAFTVVGDCI